MFVHVPKTGGTSIEKALGIHRSWKHAHLDVLHGPFYVGTTKYLLQHLPLSEVLRYASINTDCKGYFRFGFVRNPWDRLVSEYSWLKITKEMGTFDEFVKNACSIVFDGIDLYSDKYCHYMPQHKFFDMDVDFIGRFENFADDVKVAFSRLGIESPSIPHEYKTDHLQYASYYTDATRRLVYDAYGGDIAKFGYRFEN